MLSVHKENDLLIESDSRYNSSIKRESDHINQRISQLLSSQSILFAGLAVMLSFKPNNPTNQDKTAEAIKVWEEIANLISILWISIALLVLRGHACLEQGAGGC